MPRIILITLAALLFLVVAAALLVPLVLDEDKLLAMASDTLQEETGATLTVAGDRELSLFPVLGVSLQEAALTMPGAEEPGLRARSLSIGVRMMPLLTGTVKIDSIELDGLSLKTVSTAEKTPAVDTSKMSDEELDALCRSA